jgi:hypothetical protein
VCGLSVEPPSGQNIRAMSTLSSLKDRLRAMLGDQRPRKMPRRGPKPRIGAYAIHVTEGARLMVQAGLTDELWKWLQDHGWRVETHRPDRRIYRDIPASWVTRLIDADPSQRHQLMAGALEKAEVRR